MGAIPGSRFLVRQTADSGEKIGSSRKVGGANKDLGEAPKAARGRSMKARPTQSRKGVKGQLPLAGSRDSVPCGVWGNAPTVPRATSIANALNKGAGSEASLPVTLRVRRRALKLLFAQDSVKNQKKRDCAFFTQPRFLSLCNFQKRRARLIPPCPGRAPARCTARSMRRAWPSIRHESLLP